jgi:hypothetical protein
LRKSYEFERARLELKRFRAPIDAASAVKLLTRACKYSVFYYRETETRATLSVFALLMSARDDQPHETLSSAIESELYCAYVGFALGLVVILLGRAMLYLSISGKESWVAWAFGPLNEIFDAFPGASLIVAGILLIPGTRYKPVLT